MNQTQALAKLRKALGSKLGYRIDPKALDAEGREQSRLAFLAARDEKIEVEAKLEARRKELLSDPAYVALSQEYKVLKDRCNSTSYFAHHKRICVGVDGGMFFHVKAEGDNWAEVVQKVIG